MKKELKTRQQLIERLNNIDRKCIDEGTHFHDLKTLYESKEPKLSAKDKVDIKRVASIEDDPEVLKSYIDSKVVEEGLEEDFEDDDYNYDDIQYMSNSERHDLFKKYHNGVDFEDFDDFWNWAEEEFPMKDMGDEDESLNESKRNWKKIDTIIGIAIDDNLINSKDAEQKYGFYQGDIIFDNKRLKIGDEYILDVYKVPEEEWDDYGLDEECPYYFKIAKHKAEESLNEASYGGAYDIEDDMFFTRDEINEFAEDAADRFSAWANEEFYVNDVYMDSPKNLTVELTNNDITIQGETNIDFRKIKTPRDIDKYQDIILKQLKDALIEYESDINESLNEGIDIKSTGINRSPLYAIKDKIYKFREEAKKYPYWVVKTSKWYDPEGLDIEDDNIDIQYAGSYDECKNWLDKLINEAKLDKDTYDIEKIGKDFVKIYYPHAISKAIYSIQKNNIPEKNESLNETILSPGDEYDYFAVYEGDKLIGEYPTYDDALEATDIGLNDWLYKNYGIYADDLTDDDYERAWNEFNEKGRCVIKGVTQYGAGAYEETPLNEDINSEVGLGIVPFEYYIYFNGEAISEDSFKDERKEIFRDAEDDLFTFLNSELVKDTVKEKLDITIEDIEFVDNILETSYETIHGVLNVHILDDVKTSSKSLLNVLNRLLYKWEYRTEITIQGPKRDVDDWDEWDDIVYAEADLDYYEN